ncbi:hypothetical protein DsansV1_C11g0107501 [Dioscorea sansibarensis]
MRRQLKARVEVKVKSLSWRLHRAGFIPRNIRVEGEPSILRLPCLLGAPVLLHRRYMLEG